MHDIICIPMPISVLGEALLNGDDDDDDDGGDDNEDEYLFNIIYVFTYSP